MSIFERFCLVIYQNIPPVILKSIVPFIDSARKLKNKPKIPLKEKMAEIVYPDFSNQKIILIHGVSVGEIVSLENLIKKIKSNFSSYKIVLTTGTVAGQELALKKYSNIVDFITYFPLDIYKTTDKFLTSINPDAILIAETELWPNFSLCAKRKDIPLYIINGRISDKSFSSYKFFKRFLKIIFKNYTKIFAQSELDKNRFIELGADSSNCFVMPNLKFELDKKECDIDLKKENNKVLIAGSTHSEEEKIIIGVYQKLKEKIDNLKLIIAPRHLKRLDEVKELLKGLNYGLRTNKDNFLNKDIIILDTIGELSKIYALSDVAFIGGSFKKIGGHNPLEAIIYSKPCISGNYIKNFRDIYAILKRENAAFIVNNEKELYSIALKLLSDEKYYSEISKNCENCFKNQKGASEFLVNELKKILT